jgi:4-amino-4-deoxy-L-arabinose transferase-like glycosyltransferase
LKAPLFLKIWLAVEVIALAIHLGGFPLLDADEGRNAEVGREMAATNDYVMPRLDGLPYLDKPVVYFAAEAALMEILGPTELAARLPAYLFTLATAALLFWFARRLWGGDTPYVAAIVFLAMPLTIAFARTVIFDSALTFFCVAALICFYLAIETGTGGAAPASGAVRDPAAEAAAAPPAAAPPILAWAAMGLGMITKGPVTLLLVLFVALPYAFYRKRVRALFPLLGIIAFAAIIAPWVWGVTRVVPEFLRYVLVTETVERMATKALKRTGPPWYFIPYLIGGAMPWSLIALFNARVIVKRPGVILRREDAEGSSPVRSWKILPPRFARGQDDILFLVLWILIPFVFFSLNQSKRPQYILPLLPALALIVAQVWDDVRVRATAVVLAVFGALLLIAPLFFHRAKMKPEIAGVADETAIALGIAFALGGIVAWLSKRRELTLAALALPMIALPLLTQPLMLGVAERRSAHAFVTELRPHVTPQTELIGVEAFTGSLAFYLRRPVVVVTEDASELTSNYLIRRYAQFTSNPASPLKPLPYFERSLETCCPVYILRNNDAKRRALLESRGFRRVAEGAHHVAYTRRDREVFQFIPRVDAGSAVTPR